MLRAHHQVCCQPQEPPLPEEPLGMEGTLKAESGMKSREEDSSQDGAKLISILQTSAQFYDIDDIKCIIHILSECEFK